MIEVVTLALIFCLFTVAVGVLALCSDTVGGVESVTLDPRTNNFFTKEN